MKDMSVTATLSSLRFRVSVQARQKGIINESVRGDDIYILLDVCNYSLTYSLCGYTNHMSPDDHFQDLKRVIAAIGGKARRINVIMPFPV